uniref:Uncharacterized protein n=1 Tax=Panagrolaimus sp. ES5 TaxID=591445 RepID=A0AC34GQP8_9BILA
MIFRKITGKIEDDLVAVEFGECGEVVIVADGSYLDGDNNVFLGRNSYLLIKLIFDKFDEIFGLLLIQLIVVVGGYGCDRVL